MHNVTLNGLYIPDLAVELVKKSNCETFRVSTLICDEDATTIAKVRDNVPFDVRKQSDRNHIMLRPNNSSSSTQKPGQNYLLNYREWPTHGVYILI